MPLQQSPPAKSLADYHRHHGNGSSDILNSPLSSNPPEHLSEFYSLVNKRNSTSSAPLSPSFSNGSSSKIGNTTTTTNNNNGITIGNSLGGPPTASQVKRQPSLNTFTSFSPSVLDLPDIVTSRDFQNCITSYQNVIEKASKLRRVLQTVSDAANEFGEALDDCINKNPKINNPKLVHDGLINAAGLQYMIGSNQQILSRLIETSYETPLIEEMAKLKHNYEVNHGYYQAEIKRKSRILRNQELENMKLARKKTRNLNTYKNNLLNLTNQLEEIDRLKYDYYHEINSIITKFNQDHLLIKTGSLIRAQLEISEGIARKGWSGGGLDDLLTISPDLFEVNYNEDDNNVHANEDLDDNDDYDYNTVNDHSGDGDEEGDGEGEGDGYGDNEDEGNDTLETVKFINRGLNSGSGETHPEIPHIKHSPLSATANTENVLSKLSIGASTPPHTSSSTYKSSTSAGNLLAKINDNSQDESFSLPIVNNTIGSSKSKTSPIKVSKNEEREEDQPVEVDNILDDLREEE
ncbi:uncharacterized protein RJT21DRAFT_52347 [Scheffersomyces amazonensis]|uniref:uncharacterized protein n=1 Tax=Scheffersomyces amazonensis TaxID=1078765 RepID=UPI00315D837B